MSEDLIRRSDAIKALRKLGHEVVAIDKVCSLGVAVEFIDVIRTIPSADRPQGEWVYTNNPLRLDDEWTCSRCGNISFARTNFCDRCGARMRPKLVGKHADFMMIDEACVKGADDE